MNYKDIGYVITLVAVVMGWVVSFSTNGERINQLRKDVDECHTEINTKAVDRYYGHQGRALERRVEKLENSLPPEWLKQAVRDNYKSIKEIEKYLSDKYPKWERHETN